MKQSKTTFRPEIESPVCKVELKGPAAGGAAAPFRYAAPVLALLAGVWILGYDQFLIIPTRGADWVPPCPLKINFFLNRFQIPLFEENCAKWEPNGEPKILKNL